MKKILLLFISQSFLFAYTGQSLGFEYHSVSEKMYSGSSATLFGQLGNAQTYPATVADLQKLSAAFTMRNTKTGSVNRSFVFHYGFSRFGIGMAFGSFKNDFEIYSSLGEKSSLHQVALTDRLYHLFTTLRIIEKVNTQVDLGLSYKSDSSYAFNSLDSYSTELGDPLTGMNTQLLFKQKLLKGHLFLSAGLKQWMFGSDFSPLFYTGGGLKRKVLDAVFHYRLQYNHLNSTTATTWQLAQSIDLFFSERYGLVFSHNFQSEAYIRDQYTIGSYIDLSMLRLNFVFTASEFNAQYGSSLMYKSQF